MNRSLSEFGFRLFIYLSIYLFLLLHVFLIFKVFFRKLIMDLGAPFGFYCGDCFDRVVVLFNSRICACECPVGVSYS